MAVCAQCGKPLPEDARFCPSCAAPVEQPAPPSEERKVATVLFADLVGSTAMAGDQDPERVRALLDRFYDAMATEIRDAGGTVEKFVGDAVMAAFGAPVALEDHAERATHAALGMQRRLSEMFGSALSMRIGINTGEVVVGRPREGSSFVTGDVVNVAARLEQAASAGEVLVGERTASAVEGAFVLDEPTIIEAKGKPGGVRARRVIGAALVSVRPRGVRGLGTAFVGRDSELQQLRQAYERVTSDAEPHLVTVVGDPGLGKSRLIAELKSWLARQEPGPLLRTGRCLSYGHGITYWPLAEVLREHFGILDGDAPEVIEERLGERRMLGLTLGLDVAEGMHPLAVRERLHDSWAEFAESLASERPLVLLIEDVHWADDPLLDLLQTLMAQVAGPTFLITTARPELVERRPAWVAAGRNRSAVLLEPMGREHAARMLEELLGGEPPAPIRDIVVERAEGNPFFVEELLSTMIDRGLLTRRNGGWDYGDLPVGFAIPDTIQSVLAARIDLLPPEEKAALQAAAVIGRIFWSGPVYELLHGAAPDFDVLVERDFIRRRPTSSIAGEREYTMKHALTREVAYGTLPKARRAQMHATFAEWLERRVEGDEHASLLAHHFSEAVRPEDLDLAWSDEEEVRRLSAKAAAWCRRAAAGAIGRYEIDEGLVLLHRSLQHESSIDEQGRTWFEIGHASALKYDGEGFTDALEKALDLGVSPAEVYTELAFQTVQRAGMWKRKPDPSLVNGWIDKAVELTGQDSPLHAKALLARSVWNDDDESALEGSRLAESLGIPALRSYARLARINVLWSQGRTDGLWDLLQEWLTLSSERSDPDAQADALMGASQIYLEYGKIPESRGTTDRLGEVVAGLTPHHRIHGLAQRVLLESSLACWEKVVELSREVERAVEANVATPCPLNAASLFYCALANANVGDGEEAARLEIKAYDLGMEGYGSIVDPPRLRLAVTRGRLDEARQILDLEREPGMSPWTQLAFAARFDGLAAVGDTTRLEEEAPLKFGTGMYSEPFALRALGIVQADRSLIERAAELFDGMTLDRLARETRHVAAGLGLPG